MEPKGTRTSTRAADVDDGGSLRGFGLHTRKMKIFPDDPNSGAKGSRGNLSRHAESRGVGMAWRIRESMMDNFSKFSHKAFLKLPT
jgi:hypothetical protein